MGYALWLVPSFASPAFDAISEESENLVVANEDASAEEVSPHATLIAGLGDRDITLERLIEVTEQAVRCWRKEMGRKDLVEEDTGFVDFVPEGLEVDFADVVTRGSYFQCILIALEKSTPLLRLNQITRKLVDQNFPAPPDSPSPPEYFPHMSLLYASLSESEAQDQIDQMWKKGFITRRESDKPGILFKEVYGAHLTSVEVYDCNGPPGDWKQLHSIPL
uniref:2',3'-cyclic-nucleotide 3'-phosphodiesterase n=1 Tax=Melanopsichium pennsylvanicum 4 TaxID=1398559 RepID=A0A077QYY5_9BASI|nr:uncharacterized protein BN887_02993 [Melanopsichium pennsylvanicum 4]